VGEASRRLRARLAGFSVRAHIAPEHRAHARLIAFARALEPADDFGVETQRDLLLALGINHLRVVPKAGRDRARVGIGRRAARHFLVAHAAERGAQPLRRRHVVKASIPDETRSLFLRRSRAHASMSSMLSDETIVATKQNLRPSN
jgi:hypothetical protein